MCGHRLPASLSLYFPISAPKLPVGGSLPPTTPHDATLVLPMNKDILLSIVIPTRNRQELALRSIATALEVPGNDVEVVVYDSSDETALRETLSANFSDSRLKYNYSPPPVSFDEAFDR